MLGNRDDMLTPDEDNNSKLSGVENQSKVKKVKKKDVLRGDLSFIRNFNDFGMKPKLDRRG